MVEQVGCPHRRRSGVCFDCLPHAEQVESRAVWERLLQHPYFDFTMAEMEQEVEAGNAIYTKQTTVDGLRVLLPYSLFRKVMDVVHDDRLTRGQT